MGGTIGKKKDGKVRIIVNKLNFINLLTFGGKLMEH